MKNDRLEWRLEEWARWCLRGRVTPALGYSPVSPGFSEQIKTDRRPVVRDDRELEVERVVAALARNDKTAADVLRAEYRAHEKYGHALYEDTGNDCKRTHKQLGISERTYRAKLDKAKTAVEVALTFQQMEVV